MKEGNRGDEVKIERNRVLREGTLFPRTPKKQCIIKLFFEIFTG